MDIWVVTSTAKEEDKYGKILSVRVWCHGVYTTEEMAQRIADKHQAQVVPMSTDNADLMQLAYWENPGFATRG